MLKFLNDLSCLMSLEKALKAHAANNLVEAEEQYKIAYENCVIDPRLYQNYGALVKRSGDYSSALRIYEAGLSHYPKNLGIILNYANCLRSNNITQALFFYFKGIHYSLGKPSKLDACIDFYTNIIDLLGKEGYFQWAYALNLDALRRFGAKPKILRCLLLLFDSPLNELSVEEFQLNLKNKILELASHCGDFDLATLYFGLCEHYRKTRDYSQSRHFFDLAISSCERAKVNTPKEREELQTLIDSNCWNFGCGSLQEQHLEIGWKYFEYGLRTPADGAQKWQRALIKPFSSSELPLWRGEPGSNKSLLLLDEQGIGDVMMFATLIPTLFDEFNLIGLIVPKRLFPIYKRSFAKDIELGKIVLYTQKDILDKVIPLKRFDFQVPIGSVCQHRFTSTQSYSPRTPILKCDDQLKRQLRDQYLTHGAQAPKLLVGLSWKGGGRGPRVKEKSIDPIFLADFLSKFPDVRFVNLQYGNTSEQLKKFRDHGLEIISDPRINPLKDMDSWLSQVAACDGVLSVANTTIHGAGGLNIPTICLLSQYSDWRWFSDPSVERSYWYQSVGIARQSSNSSWAPAFNIIESWLQNGCPRPNGIVSSSYA